MSGADAHAHRVVISRILRHGITDRAPLVCYRGTSLGLVPASPQDEPARQPACGNPATTVA